MDIEHSQNINSVENKWSSTPRIPVNVCNCSDNAFLASWQVLSSPFASSKCTDISSSAYRQIWFKAQKIRVLQYADRSCSVHRICGPHGISRAAHRRKVKFVLENLDFKLSARITRENGMPVISQVVEIKNAEQLIDILTTEQRVVCVEYTAAWCRPCQMIKPHIDQLSSIYKDSMVIAKVDVDECPDLAHEAGVRSMPTFIFFLDQKRIHYFAGAEMNKIQRAIDTVTRGFRT